MRISDWSSDVCSSDLGIINSGPEASRLLRELAALIGAPVTSTLMGLGALPASSEQWLGMLGMHGTFEANMAMNKADLIVALGARFDDRVTGRLDRSEERRVGKECVRTCRYRWSTDH